MPQASIKRTVNIPGRQVEWGGDGWWDAQQQHQFSICRVRRICAAYPQLDSEEYTALMGWSLCITFPLYLSSLLYSRIHWQALKLSRHWGAINCDVIVLLEVGEGGDLQNDC